MKEFLRTDPFVYKFSMKLTGPDITALCFPQNYCRLNCYLLFSQCPHTNTNYAHLTIYPFLSGHGCVCVSARLRILSIRSYFSYLTYVIISEYKYKYSYIVNIQHIYKTRRFCRCSGSSKRQTDLEKKRDSVSAYFIEFSNLIYTNWGNCAEYSGNFAIF